MDTVFRRYFCGYILLGDFLIEEAARVGVSSADLKHLLRRQAAFFDRVLVGVADEYRREAESHPRSREERRADWVRRLLRGEAVDAASLAYNFNSTHLALVACGPEAARAVRGVAASVEALLLLVQPRPDVVWAWLGGPENPGALLDGCEVLRRLPPHVAIASGEQAPGLPGWRLTHRQALAALPIALRSPGSLVRYADVSLLAAALEDDLLATSLQGLYLSPLEDERDGGEAARRTLRAYFAAGHHFSAAASSLGVSRQTVKNRLAAIEERIGCQLDRCAAELIVALQLESYSSR